ncbi:hypothetical protein ACIPL1_21140 [Pseudomonas sp. NPDC090202]|uniref:hypothetical protein n=1 Tax=unclassified Pseudomonas TaxID=196821 RepID=UPI00380BBFFC
MKIKGCSAGRWLGLALLIFSGPVLAGGKCEYVPPKFESLTYKEGDYLPVYFSKFQMSLPGKPVGFLSTDGFIAVYPDKVTVGIQHIAQDDREEVAPLLAPGLKSISGYYRLIYGAPASISAWSDDELVSQRRMLRLDCNSRVAFFRVGGSEVLFHKAKEKKGIHVIVVLNGDDVELITTSGSEQMALQIIASIKRRL